MLLIHQIWLNEEAPPDLIQSCMEQWSSCGNYRLWTRADLPEQRETIQRMMDLALESPWYKGMMKYKAASDILRYEVLYRYGGLYVDVDAAPVSPIASTCTDVNFGMLLWNGWFQNGVIAAKAAHPLLRLALHSIWYNLPARKGARPRDVTGPVMLRRLIEKYEFPVETIPVESIELHQNWKNRAELEE